jgi:hypothetical protein
MTSAFGRTVQASVAEESGIYVPELPGLALEKVALADGVAQLARFIPKASFELVGLGFDVTDASTATNEVQKIQVKATAGTFKITALGQQTGAINFNASAAELRSALVALAAIGAEDVEVTGGPGDATGTVPYVITFKGALAHQDIPAMTTDVTGLTEGTKTAVVTTQTAGDSVAVDVGVFDGDLKLLGANGGHDVAATIGAKALDFTSKVRVQAGRPYYAGLGSQGGAAKVLHAVSPDAAAADLLGATAGRREMVTLAAGGYPLPKSVAVGTNAGTKAPLMALRTVAAS